MLRCHRRALFAHFAVTKLLRLMLDQRRLVDRLDGPALIQALSQHAGPADLNAQAVSFL
jgi:hypothetical protein